LSNRIRCRGNVALGVLAALLSASAFAQGTGILTGNVVSASDRAPVADVVVTATSPALQGEQLVVTDASGVYRIPQLPPGEYTIRLEKEGFRPLERGGILLRADATLRLNVELLPSEIQAEEIVVVGQAPAVDVGSASTGTTITQDFISRVAVIRPGTKNSASRSFESLAELAPGAKDDNFGVSINGASSPENQFIVDGMSVNDPSFGVVGTPLTVQFVQEVNVITGGYLPEYGRSTGGVLSALTKSGSNEFRGSVFANWAPGVMQGKSKTIQTEGQVATGTGRAWSLGDFGAELGGPLIKDRLWFYAGVDPSFNRTLVERQLNTFDVCTAADPANGCSAANTTRKDPATGFSVVNPIDNTLSRRFADERTLQYLAKLTYAVNQDHSLALSIYGNPNVSGSEGGFAFGRDGTPEVCVGLSCTYNGSYESVASRRWNSGRDLSLKYNGAFADKKFLIDGTLGWHNQQYSSRASDGTGPRDTTGLAAAPRVTWRRTTNPRSILDFESIDDPSLCGTTAAERALKCPAGSYTTGGPGTMTDGGLNRYQAKVVTSYFAQALGHHTLKLGGDFENMSFDVYRTRSGGYLLRENNNGASFDVQQQFGYLSGPDQPVFLTAKTGTTTSTTIGGFVQDSWQVMDLFTLQGGVRYDTQTIWGLDGQVGLNLPKQWSPRIGLIYDFTKQGRSKLFASYARYYENVPLDMADLSFPQQQILTSTVKSPPCNPLDATSLATDCVNDANKVPFSSSNPEAPATIYSAAGGDRVLADPGIQPQSTDELNLGAEYEVLLGRLGVSYVRRRLNNVIEDMSRDDGKTFFLGNPGKGLSSDFPLATRDYDAVSFYYSKSFTNLWLAQASYTWSRLYGNYSGLFRADSNQLEPNVTVDFDLPALTENRTGHLPGDVTHSFKAFVARDIPVGARSVFTVGLGYRARSGTPWNYLGINSFRTSGFETFLLPRGSGGRLPWVHNVDLQLAYGLKVTKTQELRFTLAAFNVFNFQQITAIEQGFARTQVTPIFSGGSKEGVEACREPGNTACQVLRTNGTRLNQTSAGAELLPTDLVADFNPNFGKPTAYQSPFSARLGVTYNF
jgi:hypothetical protein